MRRLYYASGYVLVADRTCKALLRYARALANSDRSDIVSVPVVTEGGSSAYAHLLIGPSSQLFSTPVENTASEPVDDEAIRDMERLTAELQPSRPTWSEEMMDVEEWNEWEFDVDSPGSANPGAAAEQ